MAIQRINYGSAPDDGTGDTLRVAFRKADDNFVDLDDRKAEQTDVADALAGKVDKVAGKGLSTNDYTTAEKNKLNGIAEGANNFSLPAGTNGQVLKHNGTTWVAGTDNNTTYSNMSQAEADAGTATTGRVIQPTVLKAAILKHAPTPSDVTTSASGLMTAADKVKLNGIEVGATKDWTATAVASGADLNTYQTPGSYVCSSNATSATLLNCPTSLAFTLRVWQAAGCIQEIQEYHSGNGGGLRRWTRGYYGSGAWSAWDEVVTRRYLPTPEEVLPSASTNQILKFNGTAWVAAAETNTTYAAMSATEANAGTATTARSITAAVLKGAIQTHAPTPTSVTGNAGTATKLATARQINGTNFDGSANITTANWGTARTLTIGGTGKSVNGSANVAWSVAEILPTGTNGQVLKHDGTTWVAGTDNNTTYSTMSASEANTGTATAARVITAAVLKGAINAHAPEQTTITGNAGTATKLATARTINGTTFDGSANIVTANWGTARSINIGGVTKSVNGSANVTWTADEVGSVKSFTSVPTTNQGLQIVVTSPHIRFMVWNGTKYVRAPWHAPGQLSYFLRNVPTGYVEVRSDVVLNKADFPDLAEYLGVTATTFTLDETRGEFLRALDSGRGKDSGRAVGSHQGDAGRNLTGSWYPSDSPDGTSLGGVGTSTGAITNISNAVPMLASANVLAPSSMPFGLSLDASRQWPTANEFRVTNRAYRLAVQY